MSPAGRPKAEKVYGAMPPVTLNFVETLDPKGISPEVPELVIDSTAPEGAKIVSDKTPELAVTPDIRSVTVTTTPVNVPALAGTPVITPPVWESVRFAGRFVALNE